MSTFTPGRRDLLDGQVGCAHEWRGQRAANGSVGNVGLLHICRLLGSTRVLIGMKFTVSRHRTWSLQLGAQFRRPNALNDVESTTSFSSSPTIACDTLGLSSSIKRLRILALFLIKQFPSPPPLEFKPLHSNQPFHHKHVGRRTPELH